VNATIAEFLLRHASDAKELAQRAQLLAALTQLSPQRRNELAQAVDMVCRTIAAHGGKGKVRFSLVQRGGQRCIEVSVLDLPAGAEAEKPSDRPPQPTTPEDPEAAVIQRVGELVDHFESSGWPVAGAVIRMAQTLSPAFAFPTDAEVAEWAKLLKANTAFDALASALRRARSLEEALARARSAEELRAGLAARGTDAENLTMLSLVISKTKNAIAIMEPDGTITAVNAAFVQMTGYAPSEAVGERYDELLTGPSTDAAALREYQQARDEGRELVQDLLLYRKDGATFWIESDLIPVVNAGGRLARWISIGNDITKRRQTEDALRAAKETAETNNRLKSEFLANLSHEIRTPMNSIMGMTELALSTQLTEEQRKYLQTVRSSSELLLGLLNDILDLSKIEAGKMEMEQIDFSLPDVIDDVIKTLDVKARQKSIELRTTVPASLPAILRGDPTRLRQILLNLVGNAIKFTDRGHVTVAVEEQWHSDTDISLHFSVRDTGMGIPAEQLDVIFEPFKQGDTSTTRKYGGSGLGLTISSELVRMMKGRIWVQSVVGQGSTFHFTVQLKWSAAPAALTGTAPQTARALPRPAEAADAAAQLAAPAARRLHVLVADDHDANRSLVTTVLTKRGHECVEAVNGHQVLEALARQPFDAVLMDVQMPGMDGYQATAAIRKREEREGGHVPIIALTAHAMSGDRERCLLAGMDAYLAKPLRPSELVRLVESVPEAKSRTERPAMPSTDENAGDPGYDLQAALDSLDNDVDLLVSQMSFFLNDGPVLMTQIDQAIRACDGHQLQIAAHRLKGMLARYAFAEAAALALELEQKGKHGALDGAESVARVLTPLVARLADGIRAYMERHASSR
jgi:two-component system, sensor histidine kinase and response regulator